MNIHPTAVVDPGAKLGQDVTVGPYAIISRNVVVGDGCQIMAHAHLDGRITLGRDCMVYPSASLGAAPQDVTYAGEDTELIIGDKVIIREFVTANRGTAKGGGKTTIGDNCYLMAYAHVGHDCHVGRNVIMVNNATLGGHVLVEEEVTLSGLVGVHQHVRIGAYAFIGGMSRVVQDVPPYMLGHGADNFQLFAPNIVGLRRKGFDRETINILREVFHMIFRTDRLLNEALEDVVTQYPNVKEVQRLVEFIRASKRGVSR